MYLNYDKYSEKFDFDEENMGDVQEQNLNKIIAKEDQNEKILKNNLDFTKKYHEKNRELLNKFPHAFQDEIHVNCYNYFYPFNLKSKNFRYTNTI